MNNYCNPKSADGSALLMSDLVPLVTIYLGHFHAEWSEKVRVVVPSSACEIKAQHDGVLTSHKGVYTTWLRFEIAEGISRLSAHPGFHFGVQEDGCDVVDVARPPCTSWTLPAMGVGGEDTPAGTNLDWVDQVDFPVEVTTEGEPSPISPSGHLFRLVTSLNSPRDDGGEGNILVFYEPEQKMSLLVYQWQPWRSAIPNFCCGA